MEFSTVHIWLAACRMPVITRYIYGTLYIDFKFHKANKTFVNSSIFFFYLEWCKYNIDCDFAEDIMVLNLMWVENKTTKSSFIAFRNNLMLDYFLSLFYSGHKTPSFDILLSCNLISVTLNASQQRTALYPCDIWWAKKRKPICFDNRKSWIDR